MKTAELFKNKTVFSFEVFPPKRDLPIESVYPTLEALSKLAPDFVSVTCGAGGSGAGSNRTVEVAKHIKSLGCTAAAHMPCIYLTKDTACQQLQELKAAGIENILALRGDTVPDRPRKNDFAHASDLIAFIKEEAPEFNIMAACYPEGHTEARTLAADVRNLKKKVDAGADELISQLFFNNDHYYHFLDRCEAVGIDVPIEAGIMPVTNQKQIERMVSMCGATLPLKLQRAIAKYGSNPTAMRDFGIAYAIEQIADLLVSGVDGIHVYTMNNPYIATKITEGVKSLL